MGLIGLIIITILIVFFDKKKYKTLNTPSVLLSVPFIFICLLYIQYSSVIGFYPLSNDVLYIWIFGLLFFWLTGIFINGFATVKIKNSIDPKHDKIIALKRFNIYVLNFVFCLAIVLIFTLRQAYSIYIVSGGEGVEDYLSAGIQGHLINVIKFLSILSFLSLFLKTSFWIKFKNIFIIAITIGLATLYGTKSGILILIISYFLAWSIFFNKKIKIIHVIFGIIFGFLVFLLSYSLIFGRLADFNFILEYMIMYYVSGLASMNAYFMNNGPVGIEPELIFRSYFNILNALTGNSSEIKNVISNEWTFVGNGTSINVKTFFGTIYLYGGLFYGIIATIIFSSLAHFLFVLTLKKPQNLMALNLYVYILATFCFGWFDFYLNTIVIVEYILVAVLLNLILNPKKTYYE